jgi:hypothetical protein
MSMSRLWSEAMSLVDENACHRQLQQHVMAVDFSEKRFGGILYLQELLSFINTQIPLQIS